MAQALLYTKYERKWIALKKRLAINAKSAIIQKSDNTNNTLGDTMKFKMIIIVKNANVGEIELAQDLTDYEIAQIGSKC